jgi:hypothetical protein
VPDIYHITHYANLPNIIAQNGLWSDVDCQRLDIGGRTIGHSHIKQRRAEYVVPLPPYGTVGDYVPFYFAPRSPMLYAIHKRNTLYQGGQEPVIHLVSSTSAVANHNPQLEWLFTDGHAVIDLSTYYNDLNDLNEIDWGIMQAKYWADTLQDGDRERRRQAEFLVRRFFPFTLLSEIGVINQTVAQHVQGLLTGASHVPRVVVHPNWYY